jgi:hydroxymethylpyrimidine pyrophosphatase-like HAD family hydrolase
MKTVIFDLDGTLADITKRREMSTKENGKIDWDIFFEPNNIWFDLPNEPVITMAQLLSEKHRIVIFSGRSKSTKDETKRWLKKFDVPFDVIKMRPTSNEWKFMPDDELKQHWLDTLFPDDKKNGILCVFDDRQKVVDMWRRNGVTCFQVDEGNF